MNRTPYVRSGPLGDLEVSSAEGSYLISSDGRRILDLTCGFGVAALGYGNKTIADAIYRQMSTLSHAVPSIFRYVGEEDALEALCSRTGFQSGLLTTSGSEAVEIAIKIALLKTRRPGVVVLNRGYHGQSIATSLFSGQRQIASAFDSLANVRVAVLPTPEPLSLLEEEAPESAEASQCISFLEELLKGASVGAVVVEPMQNLGGYRRFSADFGGRVSQLCQEHGALLIVDEIFTGSGRTGHWLLSHSVGYRPDIVCVGKACTGGVPGGACLTASDLLGPLPPQQRTLARTNLQWRPHPVGRDKSCS